MGKGQDKGKQSFTFGGFQSPNFTPVPDELFDNLLTELSGAEIKVLLYIMRRTFGFKKQSDYISFSQICTGITTKDGKVLDKGTGLSRSTAQEAIKGLLEKNIIVSQKRQSTERGYEATTYALHLQPAKEINGLERSNSKILVSSTSPTPYAENR